ncbi:MAG: hypothetical protein B7Z03_07065 [Hydrogenophilales bacterium 32-62-9]|nr:MAG: hypothetical protein B7Z03_07065 [Hydrogenophilales bacterium 32-62-9]
MFLIARPARIAEKVSGSITPVEQEFGLAGWVTQYVSRQDAARIREVGPVSTEGVPGLNDGNGFGCSSVGHIQRIKGCCAVGTQIQQAKSCGAVISRQVGLPLHDNPGTEGRFLLMVVLRRSIRMKRWGWAPPMRCQLLLGYRSFRQDFITAKALLMQRLIEFTLLVSVVDIYEAQDIPSQMSDGVTVKPGRRVIQ